MIERKKNCERLKIEDLWIGRRNNCIVNLITTGLIGLHKGPKKIRSTSKNSAKMQFLKQVCSQTNH